MLPAFGVHRFLPQKVFTFCKLSEELIVQIVAVSKNYDGRTIQSLLQKVGIKHHRQRFSAALCMPEHTAFSICLCSVLCGNDGFIHSEILVITCEDLKLFQALIGKTNEVLDNVKQTLPFKDALKEGIELCVLRVFVISVFVFHSMKRSSPEVIVPALDVR